MEQLLVRPLRVVPNGSLNDVILKVCIYLSKSELLSCIVAFLAEAVVVELPIVAVVVKNPDPALCSILFKGKLGDNCFLR